jgi:hypothetical protein
MPKLVFLDPGIEHTPFRNLSDLERHEVPRIAGTYVLIAGPGVRFQYPRGTSPVYYIGKAMDVRDRLRNHERWTREAGGRRTETLYWPLYEWGAAFGARYAIIPARSRKTVNRLEQAVLAMFAERYRSWPVANGVGGWSGLLPIEKLRES